MYLRLRLTSSRGIPGTLWHGARGIPGTLWHRARGIPGTLWRGARSVFFRPSQHTLCSLFFLTMLMPGDTTSNCYNTAFALTGQHCLCHLWQHVCICVGKHWVIFCVNISAFECSFWSTLKNGKFRPWTEPTVWCQPRYRIGSGWILSLVEIFFPIFPTWRAARAHSFRFSVFLQWLRFNQYRPHDDIFFLVFHYCPKFRTVDKKLSPFS